MPKIKLSKEELSAFCSQTSILIHAGVAPVESLRILMADAEDEHAKELLQDLIEAITDGSNFSDALAMTGAFPDYVLNTTRLGEQAGTLDDVLDSLGTFYRREADIQATVKSAITYPFIMLSLMVAIIVILVTKVLPIFNQVFIQLGSEMSSFASSLLSLGDLLRNYSIGVIGFLAILLLLYILFTKTPRGRKTLEHMLSSFPLTKEFYEDVALGRFARGLSLSLSAGLDTYTGIDLVNKIVDHKKISGKIGVCKEALRNGANLPEGLREADMFSHLDLRMISVGNRSGDMDKVLKQIAANYEEKSTRKMYNIISIIEPTLVIVLSIIVGLILLSVILPLMGIMSGLG